MGKGTEKEGEGAVGEEKEERRKWRGHVLHKTEY